MKPSKPIDLNELTEMRKTRTVKQCAQHYGVSESLIEKRLNPLSQLKPHAASRNAVNKITTRRSYLVTILIQILSEKASVNNCLTAPFSNRLLRQEMEHTMRKQKVNYNINDKELRVLISYIRSNGLLPIMSTNKGYYVSYKTEDIMSQIQRMHHRSALITLAANGLKKFISKKQPSLL